MTACMAPLNCALLLEKKEKLDTAWQQHTHELIEFVNKNLQALTMVSCMQRAGS